MCSFPLHLWSIVMALRDVSWVAERTNAWDAIGVVSYALVFALAESVLIFLVFLLVGLLMPRQWNSQQQLGFLGLLILLVSIWGMIGQLLFLWDLSLPEGAVQYLRHSEHPLRILYAGVLAVVAPTILIPVFLFLRSNKVVVFMQDLVERFSTMATFYLFFDLAGLVVLIVRNLGKG